MKGNRQKSKTTWMMTTNLKDKHVQPEQSGKRKYKMTGECVLYEPRSAIMTADLSFNDAVLYPNPYITVTPKGYTKHYFMGKERIATAISGGGFCQMTYPTDKLDAREEYLLMEITEKLSYPPTAVNTPPQA